MKYKKILNTIVLLMLLSALATPVLSNNNTSSVTIPPGHIFYGLKISLENLQEMLTFNVQNKLLLKQQHLEDRLSEVQYLSFQSTLRPSDVETALNEAQTKTIEIEEMRNNVNITTTCNPDPNSPPYCDTLSHSQYVLNNLLNSPTMPIQSKIGLQNAINHSGMAAQRKITSNMTQGTFAINSGAVRLIPFRSAMVYDPRTTSWYGIIIKSDEIVINDQIIQSPEYYLYPTSAQLTELENIANKVNKQKTISFSDTLRLSKLWYSIQKVSVP